MKAIRTTVMNRGPQWVLGVALVSGSFASACMTADVTDDEQTEGTQSALWKGVNAVAVATQPVTGVVVVKPPVVMPPVVVVPPVVVADPPPPPLLPSHVVCG